MDGLIAIEQKGYELIWWPTHDLDYEFLGSIFWIAVFQEWVVWFTWNRKDMN